METQDDVYSLVNWKWSINFCTYKWRWISVVFSL